VTKVTYKRKPGAAQMTRNANCLVCNIRTGGAALCNACYDKADARQAQRGHVPPRPSGFSDAPARIKDMAVDGALPVIAEPPQEPVRLRRIGELHPRDRINEQLRAKAPRAKQVKKISPKLTSEARVARLAAVARERGAGFILTEIETHEQKIAELRKALVLVTGEKKP
jgi:hypothetical protein